MRKVRCLWRYSIAATVILYRYYDTVAMPVIKGERDLHADIAVIGQSQAARKRARQHASTSSDYRRRRYAGRGDIQRGQHIGRKYRVIALSVSDESDEEAELERQPHEYSAYFI